MAADPPLARSADGRWRWAGAMLAAFAVATVAALIEPGLGLVVLWPAFGLAGWWALRPVYPVTLLWAPLTAVAGLLGHAAGYATGVVVFLGSILLGTGIRTVYEAMGGVFEGSGPIWDLVAAGMFALAVVAGALGAGALVGVLQVLLLRSVSGAARRRWLLGSAAAGLCYLPAAAALVQDADGEPVTRLALLVVSALGVTLCTTLGALPVLARHDGSADSPTVGAPEAPSSAPG
jgi:hypothetical protein